MNDIDAFNNKMVHLGVTVLMPPFETLGVKEACYLAPDSIMFCAAQWMLNMN
jgi:hypothetical protein